MVKDFFGRNQVWLLAALGVVLIYFGEKAIGEELTFNAWLLDTLPRLGWLILGTAIVNYLYEMHGKRAVLEQVRATLGVRESLGRAGIAKATLEVKEIHWEALISTSRKIDLSVSYANTWRNNHIKQLREAARNKMVKFRLLLPDPDCERLMQTLGARYSRDATAVATSVREAADFFRGIFSEAGGQARCDIRYTQKEVTYAYHRFDSDSVSVITLYHGLGKIGQVPTLELKSGGELIGLFERDFEAAFSSAKKVA